MNSENMPEKKNRTLSFCALGFSIGITWAIAVALLGVFSILFDMGTPIVLLLSSIYLGYQATVTGIIVGALWGFLDGFIMGAIIALIYNRWLAACPCPCCKSNKQ